MPIQASVPLLVKRTISTDGTASMTWTRGGGRGGGEGREMRNEGGREGGGEGGREVKKCRTPSHW